MGVVTASLERKVVMLTVLQAHYCGSLGGSGRRDL